MKKLLYFFLSLSLLWISFEPVFASHDFLSETGMVCKETAEKESKSKIKSFINKHTAIAIGGVILTCIAAGGLIYWLENKNNPLQEQKDLLDFEMTDEEEARLDADPSLRRAVKLTNETYTEKLTRRRSCYNLIQGFARCLAKNKDFSLNNIPKFENLKLHKCYTKDETLYKQKVLPVLQAWEPILKCKIESITNAENEKIFIWDDEYNPFKFESRGFTGDSIFESIENKTAQPKEVVTTYDGKDYEIYVVTSYNLGGGIAHSNVIIKRSQLGG